MRLQRPVVTRAILLQPVPRQPVPRQLPRYLGSQYLGSQYLDSQYLGSHAVRCLVATRRLLRRSRNPHRRPSTSPSSAWSRPMRFINICFV